MQFKYTPSPAQNSSPIFCGSRVIGQVTGGVFCKTILGSKHLLRQPPALAFDVCTLDDAQALGADRVAVTDRESGRVYRASLALVRSAGFPVTRGFGNQIALPLGYWSIDGQPPKNTPTKSKPTPPAQARLF